MVRIKLVNLFHSGEYFGILIKNLNSRIQLTNCLLSRLIFINDEVHINHKLTGLEVKLPNSMKINPYKFYKIRNILKSKHFLMLSIENTKKRVVEIVLIGQQNHCNEETAVQFDKAGSTVQLAEPATSMQSLYPTLPNVYAE